MDSEDVITLFDSSWFKLEIFKKQSSSSISETNPDYHVQENSSEPKISSLASISETCRDQQSSPEPKISSLPSIILRTKSDQLSSMTSFFDSDSQSPNSVLLAPHLQTILSGKEVAEEKLKQPQEKKSRRGRIRKGSIMSKSLSELEFEELKGFMDLGFVFSEEDKDSSLIEIIPGLQRLGKKNDGEDQEISGSAILESSVPRPYLSEAWENLGRRKKEINPLMNWRVPAPNNEIEMKDNLKWWAHTVASSVR